MRSRRSIAALARHIEFALEQVRGFARAQRATLRDLCVEPLPGVVLGHRHIPVGAVGAYVPGGRYPMLASSFMTVAVAKEAGVDTVVACAPPQRAAGIHPLMLHAMRASGADQVLCLGGVQGLAAMAFGLCGVEPVDMLVGAGNAYVAEAKRQLFGRVGIDLLAGPTEVLVLADATADPELVAADLLGQAEHGPTSPAVLVTTSEALATQVDRGRRPAARHMADRRRRRAGLARLRRGDRRGRRRGGRGGERRDRRGARRGADGRSRRGTSIACATTARCSSAARRRWRTATRRVGTNHVLPTGRAARYSGGLWVGKFLKTVTYQRLTPEGSATVAPAVAAISHAEGFAGHARTAELRLERAGTGVR